MIPDGYVILARLGAANGLRGDVRLEIRTDDPSRLAPGQRVITDDPRVGELTIARRRTSGSAALIAFEQVTDRTDAEAMSGLLLLGPAVLEDDAWYPADLVGLEARARDGRVLGAVLAVESMPAHDVLVVREPSGARTFVPFVTAIVPEVDVAGGFVVLDPPGGLLADEPQPEDDDLDDDPDDPDDEAPAGGPEAPTPGSDA
ncbi:MAG TPA: ribosome maturation factor RimM [Micrococcales bacterium]|uniref:ribosome maturation factor RimM n=1 Tax=Miniimonas arenae TaxID=676201 RepID=UPI000EBDE7A4|nr:ribosome maturation factor RimM [Miniimonas arenae]HCX85703.1 ribosome maturation factor RimM [Micrococcales bacterium]